VRIFLVHPLLRWLTYVRELAVINTAKHLPFLKSKLC
jgi:hypothetical protein